MKARKLIAFAMSIVLVIGLLPLPAIANDTEQGDLVAGAFQIET